MNSHHSCVLLHRAIVCCLSLLIGCVAYGATTVNVIEQIQESSDSTVIIELSPSLKSELVPEVKKRSEVSESVAKPKTIETGERNGKKVATRTNGYRIQIFGDGRNQNTLQSRARARAKLVLGKFPMYSHQVYSFSKAPNYYTRIGNFATREEASKALSKLKAAFPEFAGEMRVVQSEVIINK